MRNGISDGEWASASVSAGSGRADGSGSGSAAGGGAGGSGRGRCKGTVTESGLAFSACVRVADWGDSHAHSNSPTAASHGATAARDHEDIVSIIRRSEPSFKVESPG